MDEYSVTSRLQVPRRNGNENESEHDRNTFTRGVTSKVFTAEFEGFGSPLLASLASSLNQRLFRSELLLCTTVIRFALPICSLPG